jgi:hypothetical protein
MIHESNSLNLAAVVVPRGLGTAMAGSSAPRGVLEPLLVRIDSQPLPWHGTPSPGSLPGLAFAEPRASRSSIACSQGARPLTT